MDWQELSPADIEYLYDLAEKSDVQLTLFDEKHYCVLGGKPNQIVQNDAKLVFSDLTEISLEDATSGKYRMFQGMFLGTKEQTDDFEQRFAEELCQRFSGVRSQPCLLYTSSVSQKDSLGLYLLLSGGINVPTRPHQNQTLETSSEQLRHSLAAVSYTHLNKLISTTKDLWQENPDWYDKDKG